jgi:CheY-like chemotaxis protein
MQKGVMNILLADDDEDDCLFFKDAFKEIKIETKVEIVNDGVELMNLLIKKNTKLPNILFLDLNMPRKNGLECLKEIKRIDRLKDMVIAIYSTSASEENIEETFVNGANIYINKPNQFETLIKVLSEVTITNWQYQTSALNRDNFLLRL